MTHVLKCWPGEFEAVRGGEKLHEVRRNDRDYSVGDSLILREFAPTGEHGPKGESLGTFTHNEVLRRITYITVGGAWGLPNELCVLSIK